MRGFFGPHIVTSKTPKSNFLFRHINLLSGDVELNPGPTSQLYTG